MSRSSKTMGRYPWNNRKENCYDEDERQREQPINFGRFSAAAKPICAICRRATGWLSPLSTNPNLLTNRSFSSFVVWMAARTGPTRPRRRWRRRHESSTLLSSGDRHFCWCIDDLCAFTRGIEFFWGSSLRWFRLWSVFAGPPTTWTEWTTMRVLFEQIMQSSFADLMLSFRFLCYLDSQILSKFEDSRVIYHHAVIVLSLWIAKWGKCGSQCVHIHSRTFYHLFLFIYLILSRSTMLPFRAKVNKKDSATFIEVSGSFSRKNLIV